MIQRPRFRFAPVPAPSSGLLDLAAGYFWLSGALSIVIGVAAMVWLIKGELVPVTVSVVVRLALRLAVGAGYIWTGTMLSRAKLRGGIAALVFVALSLAGPIRVETFIWIALSLTVLAVIWPQLD